MVFCNFIFQAWKGVELTIIVGHGKSWKMMFMSTEKYNLMVLDLQYM